MRALLLILHIKFCCKFGSRQNVQKMPNTKEILVANPVEVLCKTNFLRILSKSDNLLDFSLKT